jgi:hypothetical protein
LADALNGEKKHFYFLDGDQEMTIPDAGKMNQEHYADPDYIQNIVNKICPKLSFPSSKSRKKDMYGKKFDLEKYESELKYT